MDRRLPNVNSGPTYTMTPDDASIVPAVDAATVMLVRDSSAGVEVFMMRRNINAAFVGGAYVFPGGKVDPYDRMGEVAALCVGRDDDDASRRLSLASGGLAFWLAAVRECFEEAGVLLAIDDTGRSVSFDDAAVAGRFDTCRHEVHSGALALGDLCRDEGLRIDVGAMHYHSHWITPHGSPRRFDTRFFVAAAPPEQVPIHDYAELIASMWVRPEVALDMFAGGEIVIIEPTQRSLESLASHSSVASILAAAAARTDGPDIVPRMVVNRDGFQIVVAGDAGYPGDNQ